MNRSEIRSWAMNHVGTCPKRGNLNEAVHIFARRNNVVLFATGYANGEDDGGNPIWDSHQIKRCEQ